jgi:hypothetical protein
VGRGKAELLRPENAHVGVALVIGEDQHNIGRTILGRGNRREGEEQGSGGVKVTH